MNDFDCMLIISTQLTSKIIELIVLSRMANQNYVITDIQKTVSNFYLFKIVSQIGPVLNVKYLELLLFLIELAPTLPSVCDCSYVTVFVLSCFLGLHDLKLAAFE